LIPASDVGGDRPGAGDRLSEVSAVTWRELGQLCGQGGERAQQTADAVEVFGLDRVTGLGWSAG